MQHFGSPTRLLDWTASPYVALYFAVVEDWASRGAVWCFDRRLMAGGRIDDDIEIARKHLETTKDQQKFFWNELETTNFCLTVDPSRLHVRIAGQQGFFTVCGKIPSDHGPLLETIGDTPRDCRKLVIRAELKSDFLRYLIRMNITQSSLFPGLDGLGRSIRDLVRLEAVNKG